MSNGDKRKVSTDALETLGTIITDKEKRDAIHLAVIPVRAGATLEAGMYINSIGGVAHPADNGLGIVDPFIVGQIREGDWFWMVLKPRTITSLRHVWSHPSLPDEAGVSAEPYQSPEKFMVREALEKIADSCDCDLETMIEGAKDYVRSKGYNYLIEGGRWEGMSVPDEFWPLFEIYTGEKVPNENRGSFFSCAC